VNSASLPVRALRVLWPGFVAAGAMSAVTFALVDPLEVVWQGHSLALSRQAIQTLVFLMYWAGCSAAGAVTLWLSVGDHEEVQTGAAKD
jgi:hypothetical protein